MSYVDFGQMQDEHLEWARRNFAKDRARAAWEPIMGVQEEAGELAHAFLKRHQQIRGTSAEHAAAIEDAIGDIVIYLLDVCNFEGLRFSDVAAKTWAQVRNRDWEKDRLKGGQ